MVAAATATVAVSGCVEAPAPAIGPGIHRALAASEIATLGTPGLPDVPFGEALVTFSQALAGLHATGPDADARIRDQVLTLADILERMPAAAAEPALRRAADVMRAADADAPSIEGAKRSLAVAAAALLTLAQTAYRGHPDVLDQARSFAGSVAAIDPAHDPPDHAGMITALLRAEHALAAMYVANVANVAPAGRPPG
jgi:hypothetical protein